jgi:hypothetical protein
VADVSGQDQQTAVPGQSTPHPDSTPAQPGVPGGDPQVALAFGLGWHMAALYRDASLVEQRGSVGPDVLPDVNSLAPREHTELVWRQVKAALHLLTPRISAAGIEPIELPALPDASMSDSAHLKVFRDGIESAHTSILLSLGAADFRLGQAYGLGQGLAETCLVPDDADSLDQAFGPRLASVKNWLADLTSTLSPHAGRSVMRTLRAWEIWAAEPKLGDHALDWKRDGAGVRAALRRQGELWRALLSGEKQGPDMLKTADYLKAGRAMLWRVRWGVVGVATFVLLVGGGIALLAVAGTAGKVLGALGTVAGTLGLTTAGVRVRLSSAATQLEARIWGAELDGAIAEAVLTGPENWGIALGDIDVPASGFEPRVAANLETVRQFREAVAHDKKRKIKKLLAPEAQFIDKGEVRRGVNEIGDWLAGGGRRGIVSDPQRVLAGRPGFIVACLGDGADVWRIREGKVTFWECFADVSQARQVAGLVAD